MTSRTRYRTAGTARRVASVLALAVLAGGCANTGEELVTERPAAQPGGGDGPLFVEVHTEGALAPEGHDFRSLPHSVVYADGTAFSPGAITLQYPGPAELPFQQARLTEAQVNEVLEAADEAGLTNDAEEDYGEPLIADAATTVVTVVVDGKRQTTRVYALAETGADAPRLTAEQQENRGRVRRFLDVVSRLVAGKDTELYEPERYQLLPLALDPAEPAPEGPEPQVRDWPLEEVDLEAQQCVAVTGPQAHELRESLRDANENTQWRTADGEIYTLATRPLLPHETACPGGNESPPET